jgi:hypothetical protein
MADPSGFAGMRRRARETFPVAEDFAILSLGAGSGFAQEVRRREEVQASCKARAWR